MSNHCVATRGLTHHQSLTLERLFSQYKEKEGYLSYAGFRKVVDVLGGGVQAVDEDEHEDGAAGIQKNQRMDFEELGQLLLTESESVRARINAANEAWRMKYNAPDGLLQQIPISRYSFTALMSSVTTAQAFLAALSLEDTFRFFNGPEVVDTETRAGMVLRVRLRALQGLPVSVHVRSAGIEEDCDVLVRLGVEGEDEKGFQVRRSAVVRENVAESGKRYWKEDVRVGFRVAETLEEVAVQRLVVSVCDCYAFRHAELLDKISIPVAQILYQPRFPLHMRLTLPRTHVILHLTIYDESPFPLPALLDHLFQTCLTRPPPTLRPTFPYRHYVLTLTDPFTNQYRSPCYYMRPRAYPSFTRRTIREIPFVDKIEGLERVWRNGEAIRVEFALYRGWDRVAIGGLCGCLWAWGLVMRSEGSRGWELVDVFSGKPVCRGALRYGVVSMVVTEANVFINMQKFGITSEKFEWDLCKRSHWIPYYQLDESIHYVIPTHLPVLPLLPEEEDIPNLSLEEERSALVDALKRAVIEYREDATRVTETSVSEKASESGRRAGWVSGATCRVKGRFLTELLEGIAESGVLDATYAPVEYFVTLSQVTHPEQDSFLEWQVAVWYEYPVWRQVKQASVVSKPAEAVAVT